MSGPSSALGWSFSWESSFSLSLSSFFFSPCLAIPGFGLLSQGSSLRLPSGHSGPILTLSNAVGTFLFGPSLLVVDSSVWATSPIGVAVRHVICQFYLFIYLFIFFFLPVMLPSEIPKLSTDPLVTGLPGVWKHLLFHDSHPRTGLHP